MKFVLQSTIFHIPVTLSHSSKVGFPPINITEMYIADGNTRV